MLISAELAVMAYSPRRLLFSSDVSARGLDYLEAEYVFMYSN